MSEEANIDIARVEKDENMENEPMKEDVSKLALLSNELPSDGDLHVPAKQEDVEDNREAIQPSLAEEQKELLGPGSSENVKAPNPIPSELKENGSLDSGSSENNADAADSNPSEQQLVASDAPAENKSLEKTNDVDQPAIKSTASTKISPSPAPSDKAVDVAKDIELIDEGLKDMKLSGKEIEGPTAGKKVRKTPSTPRARSTPVTSPPLTRSRSRDLRKFPSTPASPVRLASRKGNESDSEIKGARGRQRVKKN